MHMVQGAMSLFAVSCMPICLCVFMCVDIVVYAQRPHEVFFVFLSSLCRFVFFFTRAARFLRSCV